MGLQRWQLPHFAQFDWRLAFWIGACIAVIGSIARTRLRETPVFLKEQERKKTTDYHPGMTTKKQCWRIFLFKAVGQCAFTFHMFIVVTF